MDIDRFRVKPGKDVDLSKIDPRDTGDFKGEKEDGQELHQQLNDELESLQELLYADGRHRLLLVLQATDSGGKDGTIRHVFDGLNPQGVKVASFKKPTAKELARDYLWRVHAHVPGDGEIAVFNRSHYEDVLIVRVHNLVPEDRWRARYRHIREWEQMLVDEGTTIRKVYLHISKDEQRERLQARLDEPEKNWKFEKGDLAEREHWDDYRAAFTDMLNETSTKDAPWYVVPADRKWYRNLVVSSILIDALKGMDLRFPPPEEGLKDIVVT